MTDKSKLFQDTQFISADKIADLLGLCEATIYNWIKQKKIPAYKIGNQYKMTLDDVYNSMQSWISHSYSALSYTSRKNMVSLYNKLFNGYKINKILKHKKKGGTNNDLLQIDRWQELRWDCNTIRF